MILGIALFLCLTVPPANSSGFAPEPPEGFAALLRAHLSRVCGWEEDAIDVRSLQLLNGVTPSAEDGAWTVAERFVPASFGSMLVPASAETAGKPGPTFWIRADVHVEGRVVRAARRIPYRKALEPGDLEEAVVEIGDARASYLRSASDAVGMVARRELFPGQLLERDWVAAQELVRMGETVRLVAHVNGISITARAKALQAGKLGEWVRVKNLDSNRALKGLVTGPGEVTVQY
ncbi:MAG: flagellar basal body P-ring formation chaperone FlgA [Acidobacteriota bacterium]